MNIEDINRMGLAYLIAIVVAMAAYGIGCLLVREPRPEVPHIIIPLSSR